MSSSQDSENDVHDSDVQSSDVESSDDMPIEDSEFKDNLCDCLEGVTSAGSFSTYQHSALFPNPGLHVTGLGIIPLPLSEHDAKAIIGISTRAPFGKKEQTLVDTTVRKTWELNSSEFEFRNPAWKTYFEQLVYHAIVGLGVEVSVRAESYKLLLYEEGAFFKAHKDSEKVPGMFGTLVVCLPSKHEGGEVYLSHAGQKKVLDTATTSEFDISALSWYSDVKHEIRPVTSGCRLVLTYNLVDTSGSTGNQSAAHLFEKRNELQSLLRMWKRDFDHLEKFVYILEHQYTESSLRLQNLKGQDRALGQHLHTVCSSNGFYLFFAQLNKTESADDSYGADDNEVLLEHVVLPNGLLMAKSCLIEEEEEILQDSPFDRDADSEDEAEYTGNEEMPGYLRYHDTVCNAPDQSQINHLLL
jgi:hypothetical protein